MYVCVLDGARVCECLSALAGHTVAARQPNGSSHRLKCTSTSRTTPPLSLPLRKCDFRKQFASSHPNNKDMFVKDELARRGSWSCCAGRCLSCGNQSTTTTRKRRSVGCVGSSPPLPSCCGPFSSSGHLLPCWRPHRPPKLPYLSQEAARRLWNSLPEDGSSTRSPTSTCTEMQHKLTPR